MDDKPLLVKPANKIAEKLNLKIKKFAGKGSFKETFLAVDKDGMNIALKIMDPNKCNIARTEREIEAMKKCNSKRVGKLYGYGEFHGEKGKVYYFSIEEYFDGGTLTKKIDDIDLSLSQIKLYSICLAEAICHLKEHRLVHRDIKPDNIMFRKKIDEPILVDFGLVRNLAQTSLTLSWIPQGPGTPLFSSPEQLNNDKSLIDWRTDQFALGIVIGFMITKNHPFQNDGISIPGAIEHVAQRKQCTPKFKEYVMQIGFHPVLKMLEPWPIKRYYCPNEFVNSFRNIGV